jgi:CRP-like cAMP-binding protein
MSETIPENKNRLLMALEPRELEILSKHLQHLTFEKGALLYDPGDEIDTIYFPHDCVISLMTMMHGGEAIESATIGREGALGLNAANHPRQSLSRAIIQVPGECSKLPARALARLWDDSPTLRALTHRHTDALFSHAIQSVACNALHSVEARFCRWLLSCHDRIDSDRVSLTQEFLADMLGVQRTTVTVVARTLQAAGVIRYRRGVVDILDRPRLEVIACECYGVVRRNYERLLPGAFTNIRVAS